MVVHVACVQINTVNEDKYSLQEIAAPLLIQTTSAEHIEIFLPTYFSSEPLLLRLPHYSSWIKLNTDVWGLQVHGHHYNTSKFSNICKYIAVM